MQELRIVIHISASIDRVFDFIGDHENFLSSQKDVVAKIIRSGFSERNGLGCLREVKVGTRIRYIEEITSWERPKMFEYLIVETSLPLSHRGSQIKFAAIGTGTEVEWISRFKVNLPLIGPILGWYMKRIYLKSFKAFLIAAKKRLEKN